MMKKKTHSTVTQRVYEVGPQPKKWPRFTEFPHQVRGDEAHIISSTFRDNWQLLSVATLGSLLMFVGSALVPWALGIFLDSGIESGLSAALLPGALLMCGVIFVRAIGSLSGPFVLLVWLRGTYGWRRRLVTHVSGRQLTKKEPLSAGEIVSATTSDADKIGNFISGVTQTIAATVAFGVIAVMMIRANVVLGLVVTLGLPIVVGLMSFLIRPLQQRLHANREERGKLTTLAADAVVGLRVIRGVGGEDVYNERYRAQSHHVMETGIQASFIQAVLGGLTTAVPALFSAIVISLGIYQVYRGQLTYGQLVAFYGYTAYLSVPVSAATQFFQVLADAKVGARRISRILSVGSTTDDTHLLTPAPTINWNQATLTDCMTGMSIQPGRLTVVACGRPDIAAQFARRLARTDDSYDISADDGTHVVSLAQLPLSDVRNAIVLSDAVAQLFQGRLRSNLNGAHADDLIPRPIAVQMADTGDGSGIATREHQAHPHAADDDQLYQALEVAEASDIVTGLEDGLDGYVAERGRSLSGGQRQRLALARAVLTQAPILVAIEPTSAVDSHTEMRIAQALAQHRVGKTTVVVSSSPIMLHQADTVIMLNDDGSERLRGTHQELSHNHSYVALIQRREVSSESDEQK